MIITLAVAALFAVIAAVGWYKFDKERARRIENKYVMEAYVAKAAADRNPYARISTEVLRHMFGLDKAHVVPEFGGRPGKQHQHPAVRR